MVKEDRSGWVAVESEFAGKDSGPKIRPAATAYQLFQKEITPQVKKEFEGKAFDVGLFSRSVRDKWNNASEETKERFRGLAREDASRFAMESHYADMVQLERQRKLQMERSEIVFTGDGKNTRGNRLREEKKRARKEKKKAAKKKAKGHASDFDSEDLSSDDDDDDESDDSEAPKKKRAAPRKVSEAEQARRARLKREKEEKESYIAERQNGLHKDKSEQARRRLEFLLQQSDIFSHFGNVKQDSAKYGVGKSGKQDRRNTATGTDDDVRDAADLDVDGGASTIYLTKQPTTLGFGTMRPYQLEGLNWMIRLQENGINGILADEMGLGKTLQSISVLVYMMEYQKDTGPHLVVVPKSTLSNWMKEIDRWAPTLKAVKFHGNKEEREELGRNVMIPAQREENRKWNICLTTYEVCNIDKNILNKFAWSYVIIDEAHRLKSQASAFSRTIRTFETRHRLLLTGTPLQNNLSELFSLLNFIVPSVFSSEQQWDEWFDLDIDDAEEKNKLISQLHKILRPFMLRRLKADVEKSLPPKRETILFTGMSAMQKKQYRDILLRDTGALQGSGSRTALLNIVMQLRKSAGHPYLFPGAEDRTLPPLGEHLIQNAGKMVLLDKLLKRLKERGHRVLLFTQMTRILDIMEDYLVMRQFKYCRIDGNTQHADREQFIEDFNKPNSEKFIFLLSTRAGGLGINLQTADVVILYDSDWNPQADLQAQDRAHRIGQKKEVQVFRFVTEHTIEEKIVERAQQKLKLDAMVVQQGRLKEKDKLSKDELLHSIRFGADKVFKSKDSSITDDDIDMILDQGKKRTAEMNEKLQNAEKGDLLDFKLDGGGLSAQTFEGIDYAKAAQAQAEMLGIMDIGKRERKTVANYNESQLYQNQIAALQGQTKKPKKKVMKLPKYLRLPRMEEWQMFDRFTLQKISEEEEKAFFALPEESQKLANGKGTKTEENPDGGEEDSKPFVLPPLLDEATLAKKNKLLSEGFSDWGRLHYTAFTRASAKHGRDNIEKIALDVGKPIKDVETYSNAFWSDLGKSRFSDHEYERVVKFIERGEKRMQDLKGIKRGTALLISLFDNPWKELEFTHVNCKDKMFTVEEDRHLLCWAHKFGYGNWSAVKMAIRRNPNFRFDYFLRSLPVDLIGRRCEQLMKAAEKEVHELEKDARVEAGVEIVEGQEPPPIKLPRFSVIRSQMRQKAKQEAEIREQELVTKVANIKQQMATIQERLDELNRLSRGPARPMLSTASEFPDNLIPELVNFVALGGDQGVMVLANKFTTMHPGSTTKRKVCAKIEEVGVKEKRETEGDTRPTWHIKDEFRGKLSKDTIKTLKDEKERREREMAAAAAEKQKEEEEDVAETGAAGPDGNFVEFPDYDGTEEPKEAKKAFTHFCVNSRKEVKLSLPIEARKNKKKVNSILKQKWLALSSDEKEVWKGWEHWDAKRWDRDHAIYSKNSARKRPRDDQDGRKQEMAEAITIPKKRKKL